MGRGGGGGGRSGRGGGGGGAGGSGTLSSSQQTTLVSLNRSSGSGRFSTQSADTAESVARLTALQSRGLVSFTSSRNADGTFRTRATITPAGQAAARAIIQNR